MDSPMPTSVPASPALPRDPTRLVKSVKMKALAMHPAAKTAAASWHGLHGHKFEKNAGRFGKKK